MSSYIELDSVGLESRFSAYLLQKEKALPHFYLADCIKSLNPKTFIPILITTVFNRNLKFFLPETMKLECELWLKV